MLPLHQSPKGLGDGSEIRSWPMLDHRPLVQLYNAVLVLASRLMLMNSSIPRDGRAAHGPSPLSPARTSSVPALATPSPLAVRATTAAPSPQEH